MKTSIITFRLALIAISLFISNFTYAQITNSATLKTACETSLGNIVNISQSIKVSEPITPSAVTQINCPCTLIITNEQKVEFEQVNLQFTGTLSIQSAGKGEVVSVKSAIVAPSISVNLGGEGSQIATSQSFMNATAGNLTYTLGRQAKMEIYSTLSQSASASGLSATGALNITAGERFTGSIADMGVYGNAGVGINISGFEGLLKLEKVNFRSNLGSIGINASGDKSLLEGKECTFSMKNSSAINFSGSETTVKLNEIGFFGPSSTVGTLGGVAITAGAGTANFGKIEMADIRTFTYPLGGAFTVKASALGQSGGVKMEKSQVSANSDILFETGGLGTTEVKENRIVSATKIIIKTANDGSCVATPNFALTAPSVQACVPPAAARLANLYEIEEMPNLSVYPNPSNGELNIKFKDNSEPRDVIVMNMKGEVMKTWKENKNNNLMLNKMASGIYLIQVIDKKTGQKSATKFILE